VAGTAELSRWFGENGSAPKLIRFEEQEAAAERLRAVLAAF